MKRPAETWRALRHGDFRLFFAGSLISNIGTWVQSVAQQWLVLQLTGSAAWLGTVGFLSMLPSLLVGPLAGVLADRVDRRRLMILLQTVMMLCAGTLAALCHAGMVRIIQVGVLAFVSGVALAFNGPSFSATIKDLTGPEDLPSGVGLISSQFHLSRAFGPLLTAGLVGTIGLPGCFLLNALSFLAVIGALLLIHPHQGRAPAASHAPILHALLEGVRYVAREPVTGWLLLYTFLSSFLGLPVVTLLPLLSREVFHVGERGFSWLAAAGGGGALLGALVSASVGSRLGWRRASALGGVLYGTAMVLFSRTGRFEVALLLQAVYGFAQVLTAAVGLTTVQSTVPDAMRGRVMSLYGMSFMGAMTLGSLSSGGLAHAIGAQDTLLSGGLLLLLVVAVMQMVAPRTASVIP